MTAKTAPKVTLWEFFQQLGKTFMLPVAGDAANLLI